MAEDASLPTVQTTPPSEAFQALGNDVRLSIVESLAETDESGSVVPASKSFSDLYADSPADTSAGFAYHLRQLTDHYLDEVDDGYRFTYAGLKIARAISAGTYTDRADLDPIPTDTDCPFCEDGRLEAGSTENYVSIGCVECGRRVLTLPFPPGGHQVDSNDEFLNAFDRLYRHRIGLMADGFCPECGATVAASIEYSTAHEESSLPDTEAPDPVQCSLHCEGCGYHLQCPVTLCVLDHSSVVSFYRDHDRSVHDRPIWNVGGEWGEFVLADDPWYVRVSTRLDDELLSLLVGGDATVVETQRQQAS